MSGYCSESALGEPSAGTAPVETHWLFVEAPGSWGRDALADCSLPAADREVLLGLPPHWRVALVRRRDRPLRAQADRFVWLSTPQGPAQQWRVPLDAPVAPDRLPHLARAIEEPILFICTNGRRDRCCARFGRALLDALPVGRAWECSHLGGHRFAPTAVRLPDRMVLGRLTRDAALAALQGTTSPDFLRGPVGWPAPVQIAAVAVWSAHGFSPLSAAEASESGVSLDLADGSSWRVPLEPVLVPPRPLSCGAEVRTDQTFRAGLPQALPMPGRGRD